MFKNKISKFIKTATAVAISVGMLICGNNLTFVSAQTPDVINKDTMSEEYRIPTLNVRVKPLYDERYSPGANALSPEEAAQIGAKYIWDLTGESMDGKYFVMDYQEPP